MKRGLFSSVILYALLFAASPALSTIQVNLENPGDAQDVSGIGLVSGWAFSDTGAAVTVKPRIDGATQDIVIPCCGPRADVQAAIRGAPLNTGFGALINYSAITPAGSHMIGIEVSAPGETTVIVDHAVMTARPGNFEFSTSFDLRDANIAIDQNANEVVIAGVQVGSSSGTASTNLRVNYTTSSQSLVIGEAFNENPTLFNSVQSIFTANCAFSGCHLGPGTTLPASQDLSQGKSFKSIVAVKSEEVPRLLRVNPERPDQSYLLQKVEGTAAVGARMPLGAPPLSSTNISTIRSWILAGAPPPGGSSSGSSGGSNGGGGGGGGY